jgi:hypothetical protein
VTIFDGSPQISHEKTVGAAESKMAAICFVSVIILRRIFVFILFR